MKRFLIIAGSIISAVLLFLLTFLIILPSSLVELWFKNGLEKKTGLIFDIKGFQKSPPFGFNMERISIFQDGIKNPLFTLDKVEGRLSPLDIFSGGIKVFINGSAGGGRLDGAVFLKMDDTSLDIKANNMSLPYLDSIGLNGVLFNGQAHAVFSQDGCPAGIIKAEGKDVQAVKIKVMGFDVPLGEIEQAGIMLEMGGCKLFLKGLWLEGKGLSVRLAGEISLAALLKDSPINMSLEIIPGRQFMDNELLLSFIKDYRKSVNHYSIPIKGTIGAPVMAR